MIRHLVLFQFKADVPADQVRLHEMEFEALGDQIACIAAMEWGTSISPEQLHKGFSHCFRLDFEDADARDQYLVHPAHVVFANRVKASLADVLVLDYEVK